MKRISKILSVIMIVAMLFSVAVIPTSAADPECKYIYEFRDVSGNNVITNAKKGDVVRLYINLDFAVKASGFVGTFMYDKTALTLYRTETAALPAAAANATAAAKKIGNFNNSGALDIVDDDMMVEHETYGDYSYQYYTYGKATMSFNHKYVVSTWDAAKKERYAAFNFLYAMDELSSVELIDTSAGPLPFIYLFFKVNEDTELTEAVIGIDDSFTSLENYVAYPKEQSCYFITSAKQIDTTMMEAAPTIVPATLSFGVVTNPVYHVKNQIQWANKAENTVNLGVVSGFDVADIAMEFDGTKSTTVEYVGATVQIGNSAPQTRYEGYVYSANGGKSYYFRAVIAGIPADYNGGDIVVTPFVKEFDKEPTYGEAVTITAADVATYVAKLPK